MGAGKGVTMIVFDSERKLFHLQTPNMSYVMRLCGDRVLEHTYWGARLPSLTGMSGCRAMRQSFSACDAGLADSVESRELSTDNHAQEYAFFGSCDLRKPAFHAAYADGSRITKMKYVEHKIYNGKPKLSNLPATYVERDDEADTLEITMRDSLTGLTLLYRYSVYAKYDALCRNVEVLNEGSQPMDLKAVMSCQVDFERADFDMINLSGAWGRERHVERRRLSTGTTKVESLRGSSSHHNSPFFALADWNADEERGQVYGFSFVYSGNFEAGVQLDGFGQTRAFMGINSFDFNWRLEPGERFTAPEAVLVYSSQGLGGMSRIYHRLFRERLARGVWRDKERPILINNWEATYYDFDEEKIVQIAACAKKAGIELLVLDDGWFGRRNEDNCSLGDWVVNREKLPDGITGLARRIHGMGMKFGLWFEPEAVSPNSELYRRHPDWCLHVPGRPRSEDRHQLILDLSRLDVQDYIIAVLSEHLSTGSIDYIKWDMNRNMTCVGSALLPANRQREVYHRYMLGLYRVLETLVQRFPQVLFEGCSGGGGRFDAGQLHYFSQYWTSDNTDAVERLYIQHGTGLVMPSVFMGAHVSAVPNHQVGRTTSLNTRGLVAMNGQFGYELDVTRMTRQELEEVARQVQQYKAIREVVHYGELYRTASPFEGAHAGWVYVSQDKRKAVAFYFTLRTHAAQGTQYMKVPGLKEAALYRLEDTGSVYSGAVLKHYGLPISHWQDAQGSLFVFEEAAAESEP